MLPHDHVEAAAVLIAEEKACVVIISHCVHMEGAFKVHTIESCISNCQAGVTVHGLNDFHALVEHDPVWVNLSITLRIQDDGLIGPKIREGYLCTFRAHVQGVNHCIIVKIILTHITNAIAI